MNNVEKKVYLSKLLSVYGELLTSYQKEVFSLYNDEDVSLTEIAFKMGVSKQSVNELIVKVEDKLFDYESKLHIISDCDYLQKELYSLKDCLSDTDKANQIINEMLERLED